MGWWGCDIFQGDSPRDMIYVTISCFFDSKQPFEKIEKYSDKAVNYKKNKSTYKATDEEINFLNDNLEKAQNNFFKKIKGKEYDNENKAYLAQGFIILGIVFKLKINPLVCSECLKLFQTLYEDKISCDIKSFADPRQRKRCLDQFQEEIKNYMQNMQEELYPQTKARKYLKL